MRCRAVVVSRENWLLPAVQVVAETRRRPTILKSSARGRVEYPTPADAAPRQAWEFTARFRRDAYGWRSSRLAVARVKEAVREIKAVARKDPNRAADGAVTFLERASPALKGVDSSSGALGTAVNRAIGELAHVIVNAPAPAAMRDRWLERLYRAHEADEVPYLDELGEHWGDLCASADVASVDEG